MYLTYVLPGLIRIKICRIYSIIYEYFKVNIFHLLKQIFNAILHFFRTLITEAYFTIFKPKNLPLNQDKFGITFRETGKVRCPATINGGGHLSIL